MKISLNLFKRIHTEVDSIYKKGYSIVRKVTLCHLKSNMIRRIAYE